MPYAFIEFLPDYTPPDYSAKVEEVKARLDELRGQVSGGAQGAVDQIKARLDELKAGVTLPDLEGWLNDVRAKADEIRAGLSGGAQGVADEIRARVEEFRANLARPEHPIQVPPDFQAKLDQVRGQLEQLRGHASGTVQGRVDQARSQLEELRAQVASRPAHPIHIPRRLERIQGTIEAVRTQLPGAAQGAADQVRARLEELKAGLPTPEHPIELPDFQAMLDDLRAKFEELRAQAGTGANRQRLEELVAQVQGKAIVVAWVPGQGYRYGVCDAALVTTGTGGGGPSRPTLRQ